MEYIETELQGVWIIEPRIFSDQRGYFVETYKRKEFEEKIGRVDFIQDNESKSAFGVLRGLHYQDGDAAQAKLVRAVLGSVFDVAVDIRQDSPTFGKYVGVELSETNKRQLFIPRGFAHGFLVLSDTAVFAYKVDNHYTPSAERTLHCLDPDIAIAWPLPKQQLILSEKDKQGKFIRNLFV
ncbi:MAG: dTDP-4-dehydrorhamnose 3,5-epimerase [Dysgonamonadaceae bacterium]|jgi:dTDP-4-dehydrorhamnose 3,5-epimerase|nr:dTDP-4-dehydrorhamnose 3,5-epimerase [Dysgonamonadaceae bacterium]